MFNNYKIIVIVPAGRKKYMELELIYILKNQHIIDEYRIYVNTKNSSDKEWFEALKHENSDFITLNNSLLSNSNLGNNKAVNEIYKYCVEENTIYIKLDDDIVWIENDFFEELINFRIENPDPLIVFPNIINNSIIDYIHQSQGCLDNMEIVSYNCLCPEGWANPKVAEKKHRKFIESVKNNDIQKYKFETHIPPSYERVSINCICWFGKEFKKFSGRIDNGNDEQWLSSDKPKTLGVPIYISGKKICVHYSFHPQREYLDKTNILEEYFSLVREQK